MSNILNNKVKKYFSTIMAIYATITYLRIQLYFIMSPGIVVILPSLKKKKKKKILGLTT